MALLDRQCQDCVCAQDPFCCDTAWDFTCIGEAGDGGICEGECSCTVE